MEWETPAAVIRQGSRWSTIDVAGRSTGEVVPGEVGGPEEQRLWIDRRGDRSRSEGGGSTRVAVGLRFWVRWEPQGPVFRSDGAGGHQLGLAQPFLAALLDLDDLVDDDIDLTVMRDDRWCGRNALVVAVSSRTREPGSLPRCFELDRAEGCWIHESHELWLDREHAIALRVVVSTDGRSVAERAITAVTFDPLLPDEFFDLTSPPDAETVDLDQHPLGGHS